MTKYFCDRCGRETLGLHRITVQSIPYSYGAANGWPSDAVRAGTLGGELCDDCLLWLKTNWPFRGEWRYVPSSRNEDLDAYYKEEPVLLRRTRPCAELS